MSTLTSTNQRDTAKFERHHAVINGGNSGMVFYLLKFSTVKSGFYANSNFIKFDTSDDSLLNRTHKSVTKNGEINICFSYILSFLVFLNLLSRAK